MSTMSTMIHGNADESKLLRWLDKARAKNEVRPVLCAYHVRDGYVLTCDGFRIHLAEAPACMRELPVDEEGQGNYVPNWTIKAGEFAVPMTQQHTYPDVSQVIPDKEPAARVCVDSKYLKQALAGFDGNVAISVYCDKAGDVGQIAISSMEGESRYALIALVHDERVTEEAFRPEFAGEEKRKGVTPDA